MIASIRAECSQVGWHPTAKTVLACMRLCVSPAASTYECDTAMCLSSDSRYVPRLLYVYGGGGLYEMKRLRTRLLDATRRAPPAPSFGSVRRNFDLLRRVGFPSPLPGIHTCSGRNQVAIERRCGIRNYHRR